MCVYIYIHTLIHINTIKFFKLQTLIQLNKLYNITERNYAIKIIIYIYIYEYLFSISSMSWGLICSTFYFLDWF